ncbi:alpha/beta-hydrolase [Mycena floridula]|nr:alpha/beta-hydrolase [Mycena floridula]
MSSPARVERVTSSDGATIYACAYGNPSKPSIVLVHGGLLTSQVFENLVQEPRLAKSFYMVCYDLRGHGQSSKPENPDDYTSKLMADDFVAVAETFGLSNPVFLGWSTGGTVAADILANVAEGFLRGIILVSSMAYIAAPITAEMVTSPLLGELESSEASLAHVDSMFARPEEVPSLVRSSWAEEAGSTGQSNSLLASRDQDPSSLFDAGRNGLPLLVVYGSQDAFIDGKKVADDLEQYFSRMLVREVRDGSHALFYENQDEFIQSLKAFMDTLD